MSIKELNEDQVRDWSLEQKDKWWLENVYRGDMPQLNLRSAVTGALIGSVLSLTNLYIGFKTGWTLGVGITSVILSFAAFRFFSKIGIGKEMTILENNAMQSIATSAGYMTAPLISCIPAYMMVTGNIIPQWQVFWWVVALAILGALFAFPLKKRYINDEQLLFPEGYAAGVVMEGLHDSDGSDGIYKAKLLGIGAFVASTIEFLRTGSILEKLNIGFLALPHYWDSFIYKFMTPNIAGYTLAELTIRIETSIVLMGTGVLMSMRSAGSMMLGAIFNYMILAPIFLKQGVIQGTGFKNITIWALWGGVAMMTTSAIYSFVAAPSTIQSIKNLFSSRKKKKASKTEDALKHIELPNNVSYIGIVIIGAWVVWMANAFFGVEYWLGIIAIPLVFVFSIMAVKSTGLTGITPGSALGKMTQVSYSILAPGNIPTNIMTAGITSEVALNASNLLMDIKPGYMLGAKPRHQAVGHIIGIFAGGLVSIPVFYLIFQGDNGGLNMNLWGTEAFPLPSATVWKAVAELLSEGLGVLHWSSRWAVIIGGTLGILMEILMNRTKGKFPISPVSFGLAFILPFETTLSFFIGCAGFWLLEQKTKAKASEKMKRFTENKESLAAGVIAGGSIIGIILILIENQLG